MAFTSFTASLARCPMAGKQPHQRFSWLASASIYRAHELKPLRRERLDALPLTQRVLFEADALPNVALPRVPLSEVEFDQFQFEAAHRLWTFPLLGAKIFIGLIEF
jgi:hypothetical protein